jgi:hypothetical protein
MSRRWAALAAVAAIVGALAMRIRIVEGWHAAAGDGKQYYQLSQELRLNGRLAYGPAPEPLQYSRVPGYPLFLSYVAVRKAPIKLETHLRSAVLWNAILDVATALLVLLMARQRRLGSGWAGFACVIVFPLMIYLSCYGLSESLATFLSTLELYLALRVMCGGPRAVDSGIRLGTASPEAPRLAPLGSPMAWAAAAGVVAGLLQLTRVDGVAMAPAVLLAIGFAPLPRPRRFAAAAVFAIAALAVFSPWPLRNYARFGAWHPEGTQWIAQNGAPLPTGMMDWMRTWSTAAPGESFMILQVATHDRLDPNRQGIVLSSMYDDEEERQLVVSLFQTYNRDYLSPQVDQWFRELAAERTRKHPFRTWVELPLRRVLAEWRPIYVWELPVGTKRMKDARPWLDWAGFALLMIGFVGAALLARRERALVALVLLALGTRTVLHAWLHPFPVQRYLVEAFPALLLFSGYALTQLFRWLWGRVIKFRGRAPA